MNDPHVQTLEYRLVVLRENLEFAPGVSPLRCTLGDFDCELAAGHLVARANVHFPDDATARAALQPHLVAWASHAELADDVSLEFRFDWSIVIDRAPAPGSGSIAITDVIPVSDEVIARLTRGEYPAPPSDWYGESPAVAQIRTRLRAMLSNRESLAAGGYWLLTKLEALHGNRKKAASVMAVDEDVLSTLGRLTARNDPQGGRKAKGTQAPFTDAERAWLHAAVRVLALRQAEVEASQASGASLTLTRITSRQLPAL